MNEKNEREKKASDQIFDVWMKSATDFWELMSKSKDWPMAFGNYGQSFGQGFPGMTNMQGSMDSILKMMQTLSATMGKEGAADSVSNGLNAVPEMTLKLAKIGMNGYFQFQQQCMEKIGSISKRTEAYNFENLDQDMFKAWTDVYENEFKQLFNIPQVGLWRQYEEQKALLTDRFIVFQKALAEFISILSLPIDKSFKILQEKIEELMDKGEIPDDPKVYYNMWVKILEGRYLTLLQTDEYTGCLNRTVSAVGDFLIAKREVLHNSMKSLEVPTNKEMDALYKELYELKKRIKQLEKKQESN
jgi:hypothetical protein